MAALLSRDLPKVARLTAIARWVGRDPSRSNELVAGFWEYLNLLFLLDVNALSFAVGELRGCGPALLQIIGAVGEVDAAISVASLRTGTGGWVQPRFQASWGHAVLAGMRHPLLHGAPSAVVTAALSRAAELDRHRDTRARGAGLRPS